MKIDNHIVNLYSKVTRKVKPVNNIEPIRGNMESDKEIEDKHDTVIAYCPACQQRLHLVIIHSKGNLDQYQLHNLPDHVAMHLTSRTILCIECDNTIIIEPLEKKTKEYFFNMKIDCSNMSPGHQSWYDNQ